MSKQEAKNSAPSKSGKKGSKKEDDIKQEGISEADQLIKDEVELLVARIVEANDGIALTALATLSGRLRTATGTVASIPKPLKYVRPLYSTLEAALPSKTNSEIRRKMCDVLSLIAMTLEFPEDKMKSLHLKLEGTHDDLADWGHEYLRHLAGEVGEKWDKTEENATLVDFVKQIMTFMMHHQDEPAACDLAMEVNHTDWILPFCEATNFSRVAQYLVAVSRYVPVPENFEVLGVVFTIYMTFESFPNALRVAIACHDKEKALQAIIACPNQIGRKQLAMICARHRLFLQMDDEELAAIIGNNNLSEWFLFTARDLDCMAPKVPDDIFKNHLIDQRMQPSKANSHIQNLAATFVNAFVNAGFGTDKLLTEGTDWLYQTKDHRMMSSAASLGLIHLWDHDSGLMSVDKYSYSEENYIKAGGLLATGIVMSGVKSSFDPAIGLLSDHLSGTHREMRIGAILGLGFAYAGTAEDQVKELLIPFVADSDQAVEIQSFSAFALSLVFAGTCDADVSEATMACLMEKSDTQLQDPSIRYLILALGGLFLGQQEAAETLIDATEALSPLIHRYTQIVVLSCAYAASGNVVMIQKMFNVLAEPPPEKEEVKEKEKDEKKETPPEPLNYRAAAMLGVGLMAMGEEIGSEMVKRSVLHVLMADHVSKLATSESGRRAVPLAFAMLSVSNPNMQVVETLSKLSHDADIATAQSAILGLGIVAGGTNNARVATLLRNLSGYYSKERDSKILFVVRIAQGLVSLGKGNLTLSPIHSDRLLVSHVGLMGLLGLMHSALDFERTILDRYHFMLFSITPALNPRMLLTLDSDLKPIKIQVRVGLAVDTVALPGKPKAISGFQTHNSPVLLNELDRAEIATSKYRALTPVIEGIVIVEEKPEQTE